MPNAGWPRPVSVPVSLSHTHAHDASPLASHLPPDEARGATGPETRRARATRRAAPHDDSAATPRRPARAVCVRLGDARAARPQPAAGRLPPQGGVRPREGGAALARLRHARRPARDFTPMKCAFVAFAVLDVRAGLIAGHENRRARANGGTSQGRSGKGAPREARSEPGPLNSGRRLPASRAARDASLLF